MTSTASLVVLLCVGSWVSVVPASACDIHETGAVMTNGAQPVYPESARDLGLGPVTAVVNVTVGPSGNVVRVWMFKSSTNTSIDQAAMTAALKSSYAPKIVDCNPVQSTIQVPFSFRPD